MVSHIDQTWIKAQLSAHSRIDGAFVLGYRVTGGGPNVWSERFNRFKFGPPTSCAAGIAVMQATMGSLTRQLLDGLSPIGIQEVTFVPALGSGETTADPNGAVASLALHCASVFGNPFRLNLLSKNPHASLHGSGGRADMRAEVIQNADYRAGPVAARVVVVFDDFITRGDTLGAIANAIKATNPTVRVYGVAFAKNEGVGYIDLDTVNNHLLPALANLWDQHERG